MYKNGPILKLERLFEHKGHLNCPQLLYYQVFYWNSYLDDPGDCKTVISVFAEMVNYRTVF